MITAEAKAPTKRRSQRRWTFAELAAELPESNLPTEVKGFSVPVGKLFKDEF